MADTRKDRETTDYTKNLGNTINPTVDRTVAYAMGVNESLLGAFPELKRIFELVDQQNFAQARMEYFSTDYYKNLTETSAQRKAYKASRPGVYAQEFGAWKQAQIVRLAGKGIRMNPKIEALLETSYLAGDTDLQLDMKVLNSGMFGSIGGTTLGTINSLKEKAYDEGVNHLLPKNYWDKASTGLFAGTMTSYDIEEDLKKIAISAYPAYAAGIEAGKSFGMQTSALKQLIATLYEKDVDTIGNDDPAFKELVGFKNLTTNKPEPISLSDAEKILKSKEEWLTTKNARDTFDAISMKVLRDMRLA